MKRDSLPKFLSLVCSLTWLPLLVGCNLAKSTPQLTPTLDVTQALQTVGARLTQSPFVVPSKTSTAATAPPTARPTARPTDTLTPALPDSSPQPTETDSENVSCDKAAPGSPSIDATIDDDTPMEPGQKFTKIWRLVNAGTCTWTREYHAVWFFGEKLGETLSVPLTNSVAPGETVEISVDMVAPEKPGTYQSNWKLANASAALFGIGPNGDLPFWVRILVIDVSPSAPTETSQPSATPTLTPTPTPIPTPTATPVVKVSGEISLLPGDLIDLDNNTINPPQGQDMAYQSDASNNHWLVPQGGGVIGVYGGQEPSPQICRAATMSMAPIAIESLSPGAYLCYHTNKNLYGWLKYVQYHDSDGSILVDILTWGLP